MNYFNDLECLSVMHSKSHVDSPLTVAGCYVLGLMSGGPAYVIGGTGIRRLMSTPFLYWVIPGRLVKWGTARGGERDNWWINLNGERAKRMVAALDAYSPEHSELFIPNPLPLTSLLQQLESSFHQSDTPARRTRQTLLVEQFMGEVWNFCHAGDFGNSFEKQLHELVARIVRFPEDQYDFKAFAAEQHVSYEHFRRMFKQIFGSAPYDFVLSKRLFKAMNMLREQSMSIKEVSFACGFSGLAEFSRFFRRKTGVAPSKFVK